MMTALTNGIRTYIFYSSKHQKTAGRTFISSLAVTPNNIKRAIYSEPTGTRQYVIGYRRHRLLQQFTDIPSQRHCLYNIGVSVSIIIIIPFLVPRFFFYFFQRTACTAQPTRGIRCLYIMISERKNKTSSVYHTRAHTHSFYCYIYIYL